MTRCVDTGAVSLRDAGMAHDILKLRHTGWFSDSLGDETIAGQVWRLPARKGAEQFVAGYDEGNGYIVTDGCLYDDLRDAAHAADETARMAAEREREHDERWQEARQADEARDEARDELRRARADALAVVAALRELPPLVAGSADPFSISRARLCDDLREFREVMRASIEIIETKTATIADLEMSEEF